MIYPMVRKLRNRFVITAMSALLVIIVAMIAVINIINFVQIVQEADSTLSLIADNGGSHPGPPDRPAGHPASDGSRQSLPSGDSFTGEAFRMRRDMEAPFETRYFTVSFSNGAYTTEVLRVAAIGDEEAKGYAAEVYPGSRSKGFYGSYRFLVREDAPDTLIIFLDCSSTLYASYRLLLLSILIGAAALVSMFILVRIFSVQAVSPAVESMEKQKRFITDAGHELKTPLAVISADIDVLEMDGISNEWTKSIKNQTKRMTELVKNLLILSRMDEDTLSETHDMAVLNFTDIVESVFDSFRPVAEGRSLGYEISAADGLSVLGDRNALTQIATILIDNALKYCADDGTVTVVLREGAYRASASPTGTLPAASSHDKETVCLEVSNPCSAMPEGNLDRLFDRFYRADESRSRKSGGFGIGLSAARAIASTHRGEISAHRDGDKTIRFTLTLPAAGGAG